MVAMGRMEQMDQDAPANNLGELVQRLVDKHGYSPQEALRVAELAWHNFTRLQPPTALEDVHPLALELLWERAKDAGCVTVRVTNLNPSLGSLLRLEALGNDAVVVAESGETVGMLNTELALEELRYLDWREPGDIGFGVCWEIEAHHLPVLWEALTRSNVEQATMNWRAVGDRVRVEPLFIKLFDLPPGSVVGAAVDA